MNNFVFYEEQFRGGFVETVTQRTDIFNGASNGAIVVNLQDLEGRVAERSFLQLPEDIQRADLSDNTEPAQVDVSEDLYKDAYIYGRLGPYSYTRFDAQSRNQSAQEYSANIGESSGRVVAKDHANSAIASAIGAMTSLSGIVYQTDDGSGGLTEMTTADINSGIRLFGDKRMDMRVLVMHSKVASDLIGNNLQSNVDAVGEISALDGVPATLGLPVLMTDAPQLEITDGTGTVTGYRTLALVEQGIAATEILRPQMSTKVIHRGKGVGQQVMGDYTFKTMCRGFSFDADAVQNPGLSDLGDSANWTYKHGSDVKYAPGVIIETL